MRIAFITYMYGRKEFGIGKYGWYLTNELRRSGVETDVLTTNIHLAGMGPLMHSMKYLFRRLHKYDLIHSNEGSGIFVSHPVVLETYHHDYGQVREFGYDIFNILETEQCRRARHIIVPSFSTKDSLLGYSIPSNKISVIYHGVDHTIFRRDEVVRARLRNALGLSDRFVVINVGRQVKHKRQIDIIKAMRNIHNSVLILVGKGDERSTIELQASRNGVRTLILEDISEQYLSGIYNAADVCAHTAYIEGFGLSVVEAMACGTPVVAYTSADFGRILDGAGFLIEQGDTHDLHDKMRIIRDNPALVEELSARASQIAGRFSWKNSADLHRRIYEYVLEKAA